MLKKKVLGGIIFYSLFMLVSILLTVSIPQANAQCNIIWWGEESGYAPTLEDLTMRQATREAFSAIWGGLSIGGSRRMGGQLVGMDVFWWGLQCRV